MSSKLEKLREEAKKALDIANDLQKQIADEEAKELERENTPIRYDSEARNFKIRIPSTETNSGYTEIELTLTEDQFDDLYQEISKEKVQGLLTSIREELGNPILDGGWKKSPPIPGWGDSFPDLAKLFTDSPLRANY